MRDLYHVSSHNGARPLCYPWQGKVISRSGWTGTVKDLYGEDVTVHSEDEIESFRWGGGLFGVNCRHYPMNFIPGFSTLKGQPQDPEENEQAYAESQQQRALERRLREERRDLAILRAQGADPEAIQAQRAKVSQASSDIDAFCDETGRARRRSREYTPVDATWPEKDTYDPTNFPTDTRDQVREFFVLQNSVGSSIIDSEEGYYRRRKYINAGTFAELQEPMTIGHVKRVMRQMGVLDKSVSYQIDDNPELLGRNLFGYTSPDGRSVTFYPDAFSNREQLVKTAGHETVHVKQVRKQGEAQDSLELVRREREAVSSEDAFWEDYQKRMKI